MAVAPLVAAVLVVTAGPASAHEQRKVGAYQFTVGWQREPTYAGVQNAIQLFLKDTSGDDPGAGLLQDCSGRCEPLHT